MRRSLAVISIVAVLALVLVPALAPVASAEPHQTSGGSGCGQFYTVRYGDTLYKIAQRFRTTVAALTRLNALPNPNRIVAGQVLCVRADGGLPWGFLYEVKRGDTLYSIARRFGWSVGYLASVNHLPNPNRITAGQILLIPYH